MNMALAASTTIDTHDEWVERLWLATEKTVTSRPNTEVAWSVIENDRQRGNAERRRRHTEILHEANDHLDPERGALRIVDASAMLGGLDGAHRLRRRVRGGAREHRRHDPRTLADRATRRHVRRSDVVTRRDGKAVLIVVCGMDWLDREWGPGRVQQIVETAVELRAQARPRVAVLIEQGGAHVRNWHVVKAPALDPW